MSETTETAAPVAPAGNESEIKMTTYYSVSLENEPEEFWVDGKLVSIRDREFWLGFIYEQDGKFWSRAGCGGWVGFNHACVEFVERSGSRVGSEIVIVREGRPFQGLAAQGSAPVVAVFQDGRRVQ